MAMASRDSVTVSIAAEMIGIESSIVRVRRVAVVTSAGRTEEAPGFNRTSSKVRYSGKSTRSGLAIAPSLAPAAGDAAGQHHELAAVFNTARAAAPWRSVKKANANLSNPL